MYFKESDKTYNTCNTCFDRNFCHLQLINVQSVGSSIYRVSNIMLIMINGDIKLLLVKPNKF